MADSKTLFVLLEVAAGYSLFEVVAFEEIGGLLEDSKNTVTDLARFSRAVKLKAFLPFESAEIALENANAISEHAMTSTLQNFLEMNLPVSSSKKKSKISEFALGVIDPGLATAISEGIHSIQCRSDDTVREIIRGCRLHLTRYIKGLDGGSDKKAQLGLGHSYSRCKVKFNPARSDNMIIQSIALLDQLDKDVNTFAMRVREWYSYHFPELASIVKDNLMYARTASFIQDKSTLLHSHKEDDDDSDNEMDTENEKGKIAGLIEIVGDEEIAKAIIAAAKTSMGMDCSQVDMVNIVNFTQRMVKLAEYRQKLSLYLTEKMNIVAPNLSALIGDTVGARLISKAGSLTNLAKAPASTVQILGAEKALFRALKTKGNTPKYGLIYHSTFIGRADAKNKGRISRYLANKCSLATRIDSFSSDADSRSRLYGERLRDQVEERLKFYETGAAPKRNIDVMEQVAKELKAGRPDDDDDDEEMEPVTPKSKRDKKKEKKESSKKKAKSSDEDEEDAKEEMVIETPKSKKKKDKKKDSSSKKRKSDEVDDDSDEKPSSEKKSDKKKKKKKKSKGGE